jgi:hypothetical protein
MSAYRRHRALQNLYAQACLWDESHPSEGELDTSPEVFPEAFPEVFSNTEYFGSNHSPKFARWLGDCWTKGDRPPS